MSFKNSKGIRKDLRSGKAINIILMLRKIWIYCWGKKKRGKNQFKLEEKDRLVRKLHQTNIIFSAESRYQ